MHTHIHTHPNKQSQAAAKNPERTAQRKLSMGSGTVEGKIESVLKTVGLGQR